MWPLTGHAAFTYDCDRWRHGCGSCPYPNEYPRLRRDRTALNWRFKRRLYSRARLTLVVSSSRLAHRLGQSPLLSRFPVRVIPIGIDIEHFAPRPKAEARTRIGASADRPLVLCFDGEARKGADLLPGVLAEAAAQGATGTVAVAGSHAGWAAPRGFELLDLGRIADEHVLADAYAAADVFLFPTRDDFFPNAVLESIASGTPVVSTSVGGIPDQAPDGEAGLLAPSGATGELGQALARLLLDTELRDRMAQAARARAVAEFSREREIDRFVDLYGEVTRA
jgi:glycosyltransferase involved in cell wall biosynthesis